METTIINISKKSNFKMKKSKIFNLFILFTFTALCSIHSFAQTDTNTQVTKEEIPSIENMKNTGAVLTEAIKEENRLRLEKQAHEEFMGYIYMIIGFSLVIAVAWLSTSRIKKITEKKEAEKRKFLEDRIAKQGGKITHREPKRGIHKR
jgi:hypothetical protein